MKSWRNVMFFLKDYLNIWLKVLLKKVDRMSELSSHEALKLDEIKIEEHEDLNGKIYEEDVSYSLICFNNVNIFSVIIIVHIETS